MTYIKNDGSIIAHFDNIDENQNKFYLFSTSQQAIDEILDLAGILYSTQYRMLLP